MAIADAITDAAITIAIPAIGKGRRCGEA